MRTKYVISAKPSSHYWTPRMCSVCEICYYICHYYFPGRRYVIQAFTLAPHSYFLSCCKQCAAYWGRWELSVEQREIFLLWEILLLISNHLSSTFISLMIIILPLDLGQFESKCLWWQPGWLKCLEPNIIFLMSATPWKFARCIGIKVGGALHKLTEVTSYLSQHQRSVYSGLSSKCPWKACRSPQMAVLLLDPGN